MEPTKSGEILFKESDSARVEAIETEPLPLLLSIWKRSQLKVLRPLCACWTRHEAIMDHSFPQSPHWPGRL
jgi:hypothetical protein